MDSDERKETASSETSVVPVPEGDAERRALQSRHHRVDPERRGHLPVCRAQTGRSAVGQEAKQNGNDVRTSQQGNEVRWLHASLTTNLHQSIGLL